MFEFLDHPSETLVRVRAATINEVFRDAAMALFEIMTDTKKIRREESYQIQASAAERHLLLIDWLNDLILLHESKNIFLSDFEVSVHKKDDWHFRATVKGEKIQRHHEKRSHAKSATYGQLQWIEKEDKHEVLFVVDI